MHIEDSYEGAVRRLARMSNAGIGMSHEDRELRQRMRDLEELATLASEENERLEKELAHANETIRRLQQQVMENDRDALRDLIETPKPVDDTPGKSILPYFAALFLVGAAVAAVVVLRPWVPATAFARPRLASPWVALHNGRFVPVEPPIVFVAPPKPAPVVVAAEERAPAPKKHKRHQKSTKVAKKETKAKPAAKIAADDPLLGL